MHRNVNSLIGNRMEGPDGEMAKGESGHLKVLTAFLLNRLCTRP